MNMRIFINDRQLKIYTLLMVKTLKSENSKYKSKTYHDTKYFEFVVAKKEWIFYTKTIRLMPWQSALSQEKSTVNDAKKPKIFQKCYRKWALRHKLYRL